MFCVCSLYSAVLAAGGATPRWRSRAEWSSLAGPHTEVTSLSSLRCSPLLPLFRCSLRSPFLRGMPDRRCPRRRVDVHTGLGLHQSRAHRSLTHTLTADLSLRCIYSVLACLFCGILFGATVALDLRILMCLVCVSQGAPLFLGRGTRRSCWMVSLVMCLSL